MVEKRQRREIQYYALGSPIPEFNFLTEHVAEVKNESLDILSQSLNTANDDVETTADESNRLLLILDAAQKIFKQEEMDAKETVRKLDHKSPPSTSISVPSTSISVLNTTTPPIIDMIKNAQLQVVKLQNIIQFKHTQVYDPKVESHR